MSERRTAPALALALALAGLPLVAFPPALSASGFPPVRQSDREMTSVPDYPEAPAVVLYRDARFTMMGTLVSQSSSSLEVEGRIKLLTEEGKKYGEVRVPHSDFVRLVSFEGRTVLPDGREVPVPEDAVFQETVTGQKRWSVTTATFPAIEPGAILDYRYELRFESIAHLDPWYFQDWIPTLHSEITYYVPGSVAAAPWGVATFGGKFQSSQKKTARGTEVKVWMDDLPPVPDEPEQYPFEDLSSRFLLLPTMIGEGVQHYPLFGNWRSTCDVLDSIYADARHRDGAVRAKGKALAKKAGDDPEARARAIFAYVRDSISTAFYPGVAPLSDGTLDDMLRAQRADSAGKALMLQAMLGAAGIDADLVWAADRRYGRIDLGLANPNWFEKVLVRLCRGEREVFLDPGEPGNGFGYLDADLEGMGAVVYDRRKPEQIELPTRPWESNARHARVELRVGDDGALGGTGHLVLEGHDGATWLLAKDTSEDRRDALTDYLKKEFPGFDVGDVKVTEDLDASRIELTWSLAQRAEEVLGDQATVVPSRPLGPIGQRFTLAPSDRLTPVLLPFADRDEVELTVSWPDGWRAEAVPEATSFTSAAGAFTAETHLDEAAHTLSYTRRFDTREREFVGRAAYTALRGLYAAAEQSDAQKLLLLHE